MKVGPRYKVKNRRRREGRTNFRKRYILVSSKKYRFVVRPASKNIIMQLVSSQLGGDQTLVSSSSKELVRDFGWEASRSNVPSAYLVGYLCARKALKAGIISAIMDIGMSEPTKGNKVFAGLKGAIDGGLEVPHGETILPTDDRIEGKHIVNFFNEVKTKNNMFMKLSSKFDVTKYPQHVKKVKANIDSKFTV